MTLNPPHILFGSGSGIIPNSTPEQVASLFTDLKKLPITLFGIDTAAQYPSPNPGESERILGEAGIASSGFVLDTKVARNPSEKGAGSLKRDAILKSASESLERLRVDKVRTLYAHAPDTRTPIAETVGGFGEVLKKGFAESWSVSNFTPEQMKEVFRQCEEQGVSKPLLYQGMYHAICRRQETDLLPLLRKYGVKYYAYSPTAGGLLTDRVAEDSENIFPNRALQGRTTYHKEQYVKPEIVEGLKKLRASCLAERISVSGASMRWLVYHSKLGKDDGVILGASKVEQVDDSAAQIAKGPLSENLVTAFEDLWQAVKGVAPVGY